MYSQWVSSVLSFSSEYSAPSSGTWPATNVIGPSNTYPNYGDLYTAWAPARSSGCDEYLELEFEKPVFVRSLSIYETYNPGAVVRIMCRSPSNEYDVLYDGDPHQKSLPALSRIFCPSLSYKSTHPTNDDNNRDVLLAGQTGYVTQHVMILLDTRLNVSWSEIDAVQLHGTLPRVLTQTLKNHYSSLFNHHRNSGTQEEHIVPFSDFTFVHYYHPSGEKKIRKIDHEQADSESGVNYHLHSVILKYRCPDLYRDMKRQQEGHDTRLLNHIHPSALYTLLYFIYCDEISILDNQSVTHVLDQLYPVSIQYNMSRLKQVCEMFNRYRRPHLDESEQYPNYSQIDMSIPVTLPDDMMRALKDANTDARDSAPDVCFIVRQSREFDQESIESNDSELLTEIYAHKAILCTRSAYFHALLMRWGVQSDNNNTSLHSTEDVQQVTLDDIDAETFQLLLNFIYSGELQVSVDNAIHLLMSGRQYLLEDFEEPVLSLIKEGIDENNVVDLLNMAYDASVVEIMSMCCQFLLEVPNDTLTRVLENDLSQELKNSMIELVPELQFAFMNGAQRVQQYVHAVSKASNAERTESLVGKMTNYPPSVGERGKYWASEKPNDTFIELEYDFPMFITGIKVCEMGDPDSIARIAIFNSKSNTWDDIYERKPVTERSTKQVCKMLQVPNLKLMDYQSKYLRLSFDGMAIIGSVQIQGYRTHFPEPFGKKVSRMVRSFLGE